MPIGFRGEFHGGGEVEYRSTRNSPTQFSHRVDDGAGQRAGRASEIDVEERCELDEQMVRQFVE